MDRAKYVFEKTAIIGPFLDVASAGVPSIAGYFIGRNRGKQVAETGKGKSSTIGTVSRILFVPGAIGYEIGKTRARKDYEKVLNKKGEYQMDKAEATFQKIAVHVEDNRPEAGYFARNMAASRAIRRGDKGAGKLFAKNEVVGGRMWEGLKKSLIGAGMGAAVLGGGVGGAKLVGKLAKIPRLAEISGEAIAGSAAGGAVTGLVVGDIMGQYQHDKKYLKGKGIDYGFWGVKGMTPEAKKKYLRDKYRGGGYKVASTDKAVLVYDKLEKDAQFWKALGKRLLTGVKDYGKNISKDIKAVKNTTKGSMNIMNKAKATGKFTEGQTKGLQLMNKKQNQALVGLAGRVGLPAVLGYNMLNND